ncbi:Hypothetical protein A7982_07444 [Minicystis rosea]|nr:Hypothetical protein A7982_07444 [Minicystis rosea]
MDGADRAPLRRRGSIDMSERTDASEPLTAEDRSDPRAARARTSVLRFASIVGQLMILAAVCRLLQPAFFALALTITVGFAAHYWTPFRFKEPVWFVIAVAGGAFVAGSPGGVAAGSLHAAAEAMAITLALSLIVFAIVSAPVPYAARVALVAAMFAVISWLGGHHRHALHLTDAFYRVFGSVFMFHVFLYVYEARRFRERPSLTAFLRYFFMLPSFRLTLPFVDFQRLGQSYYQRDIHVVAQQGIRWIVRGGVQYAIYLWAAGHIWFARTAHDARTPRMVATHLVLAYCLYLRTSGLIHAFLGTMHLFGYDLPEGYRWYWLAHRPIDFWRRCNVYWKDAMTKIAYFPVYFALRRRGDALAKIAAMVVTFALSWILHLWRLSWLTGLKLSTLHFLRRLATENAHWLIFGVVATIDLMLEIRAEKKAPAARRALLPKPAPELTGMARWIEDAKQHVRTRIGLPAGIHPARAALQIAATWMLAASLFSLQHAPSIRAWIYTMKFWG